MRKFFKHVFTEHRYPAIAVILLIIVFSSVPEMQAREMKQASAARIATLGAAFGRLAESEDGGSPNYLLALRRSGLEVASLYSGFSKATNGLALRMEEVFAPSSNTALKKAISGGVLAVGTVSERGDTALFDIEIAPTEAQTEGRALPVLVLTAAFLFVLVMIIFAIRKIKKNAVQRIKN